jgi:hypothetical protein
MLPGGTFGRDRSAPPPDRPAGLRSERPLEPAPTARTAEYAARPNPLLRREGSLRDSILKKPLNSLYEKD